MVCTNPVRLFHRNLLPLHFFLLVFLLSLITDADSYGDLDSKSAEI